MGTGVSHFIWSFCFLTEGLVSKYRFALEGSPDDCSIADSKLGQPIAGKNPALGDVEGVHDGDDVVAPGTRALDIFEQLAGDELMHVAAKI